MLNFALDSSTENRMCEDLLNENYVHLIRLSQFVNWNLSCVVLPQLFALGKNTKEEHVMENKKVKPTTPNKEK